MMTAEVQNSTTAASGAPRPQDGSLGISAIVGYAVGDFAFNLTFTFCSLYLLYYYTDVLGISGTTAGMIIMVALIWEGITDPIAGIIANRTATRWGRYRPYLLFGALPLSLSFAAMFVPVGLEGAALAAYAFATHLLFRTVFTLVNIPYIALSAQLTRDSLVRGKLAGARMLFAISCGLILAALSLPLANAMGGGAQGFFLLSLIYGAAAVAILLLCFSATREEAPDPAHAHPPLSAMLAAMRTNRPFLQLLGATVLGSVGYTLSGKALVYYMKYYVGSEAAVTAGLVTTLGAAAIAMVPWIMLTKRIGKRNVWLSGAALSVAGFVGVFALSPRGGAELWLLLACIGVGNAAFILTFWSMLPDTVEYGEWKTGTRAEGAIFGLIAFSQKIALGIGTGMVGILLDAFGYRANQAQSAETLTGIVMLYSLVPMALYAAAAGFIWFYRLDQRTHARLRQEIDSRVSSAA